MKSMFKKILFIFLFTQFFSQISLAESIIVFDFTEKELKNLKVKKVKGETTWTLGANEKGP